MKPSFDFGTRTALFTGPQPVLTKYFLKHMWSGFPNVYRCSKADALCGLDIFRPIIQEQHIVSWKIECMKYVFEERQFRLCSAQPA